MGGVGNRMRYYKSINDEYLIAVGIGAGGEEINETEYNQLLGIIANRPTAQEGYDYKLHADTLEWELVEMPVVPVEDEDADITDYENALSDLGVTVNEEE